MMNANKTFSALIFVICSCNTQNSLQDFAKVVDESKPDQKVNSFDVQHHADSVFFSLNILDNRIAHNYFVDYAKKNCIVMTKKIQSLDKFFSPENIVEAINYFRENNKDPVKKDIRILTVISIKKNDGSFENVCVFPNTIYVHSDGTFGISEFKIELKDNPLKTKKKMLQVIIEPDAQYDSTVCSINFSYNQNSWKLISRERFSSAYYDIKNKAGYCIDTMNTNFDTKTKELSQDCIFNFDNSICY